MIKLICGGKKSPSWLNEAAADYLKRLRKPYNLLIEVVDDEKLSKTLEKWPFDPAREFVILADERGDILTSPQFNQKLATLFNQSKDIIIIIGGAYGFTDVARAKADFLWSFSRLVFPHLIARLVAIEQIYRAYAISTGSHYHHE